MNRISKLLKIPINLLRVTVRRIKYANLPIADNKVFVMTYDNKFTCNPRYITEELLKSENKPDIVWAGDINDQSQFPDEIRVVKRGSAEMFREQATARIWIDNAINCVWYGIPKSKDQVYINTWHGSMGIKKITGGFWWRRKASLLKKYSDYCVTNSTYLEDIYKRTLWPNSQFLKYGHPRNDLLFNKECVQKLRHVVRDYYNLPDNTNLIMYAPTFRDDGHSGQGMIDYSRLRQALEDRFGGTWKILVRLHFQEIKKGYSPELDSDCINAADYPVMAELMAAVDIGITDYSSWAYDYVLTRKPLFIYAYDLEKYENSRGLYYSIYDTPFPISRNQDDLFKNIQMFDNIDYLDKVERFLVEKGCYEEGKASIRCADFIERIIRREE